MEVVQGRMAWGWSQPSLSWSGSHHLQPAAHPPAPSCKPKHTWLATRTGSHAYRGGAVEPFLVWGCQSCPPCRRLVHCSRPPLTRGREKQHHRRPSSAPSRLSLSFCLFSLCKPGSAPFHGPTGRPTNDPAPPGARDLAGRMTQAIANGCSSRPRREWSVPLSPRRCRCYRCWPCRARLSQIDGPAAGMMAASYQIHITTPTTSDDASLAQFGETRAMRATES